MGWFIVYIKGSQVRISALGSVDHFEMTYFGTFHLILHCVSTYQFRCFQHTKV